MFPKADEPNRKFALLSSPNLQHSSGVLWSTRAILPADPGCKMGVIIPAPCVPLGVALGLPWDDKQLSSETLEAIYRLEVALFLLLDGDLTTGVWACFLWKEDSFSMWPGLHPLMGIPSWLPVSCVQCQALSLGLLASLGCFSFSSLS